MVWEFVWNRIISLSRALLHAWNWNVCEIMRLVWSGKNKLSEQREKGGILLWCKLCLCAWQYFHENVQKVCSIVHTLVKPAKFAMCAFCLDRRVRNEVVFCQKGSQFSCVLMHSLFRSNSLSTDDDDDDLDDDGVCELCVLCCCIAV